MGTPLKPHQVTFSEGFLRILQERQRQIDQEGFDLEHDKEHDAGELARAAACYAASAGGVSEVLNKWVGGELWPWAPEWDKRKEHSKIRQLEIAGALIVAELDRLLSEDS